MLPWAGKKALEGRKYVSGGMSVEGGDGPSPPAHSGEAPLLSLINGGCFPHLWGCRVGGKH